MTPGIVGQAAPPLRVPHWRAPDGAPLKQLSLSDLGPNYKLLYCFQSWCQGCHSHGFPSLTHILENTPRDVLQAAVIQTVFEGHEENTIDKAWAQQVTSALGVPFGHDPGSDGRSTVMADYRTNGTPWFILIDPQGLVVFNDFHVNAEGLVNLLTSTNDAKSSDV